MEVLEETTLSLLPSRLSSFPSKGLMPTKDTQAASFLKKYPEYDGRNTVVAVLDTGIDPTAANLQVTTDGKPKIIDIVDCTGAGDVDMSTVIKPQVANDGCLTVRGLSGRTLILGADWKNPTGEFRVGIKPLYDLLPNDGGVATTIKTERKESFMKKHRDLRDSIEHRLAEWKLAHGDDPKIELKLQAERDELESQKMALQTLIDKYEDNGPIIDCVMFHDGEAWRAIVDTTTDGDLRSLTPMTDYAKERQISHLLKRFELYYTVNIYDDGGILSIVTVMSAHSTHVAGIIAAHDPNDSAMNGVAPGAQLISLKIADNRVNALETGPALTRAANAIIKHKADLANMSFGEPTTTPNQGFWVEMLQKYVIRTHHCTFVSSAGNEGPNFNSVGCPGGTTEDVIGVGAYVGHADMEAEYSLLEPVKERPFTWSSRGPTADGSRGVDIYAPGSAITSFPRYTKRKYVHVNGTSMSSPNLCGCLALLVSGLKAKGLSFSPYSLHTAILNTAKSVNDAMSTGFIQVEDAWSYLVKYSSPLSKARDPSASINDLDVAYDITVMSNVAANRGFFIHSLEECMYTQTRSVKVTPKFLIDPAANYDADTEGTNGQLNHLAQLSFNKRIILTTTKSWIRAPDFLFLNSSANTFNLQVNPKALTPGELHYGEVRAYDSENPDRGPLFSIPVTVIKPEDLGTGGQHMYTAEFAPGEAFRRFIHVPIGATLANIQLTNHNHKEGVPAMFYLVGSQIFPQRRYDYNEFKHSLRFSVGSYGSGQKQEERKVLDVKVVGGHTLLFTATQFWSNIGKHWLDIKITFGGASISPSPSENGCEQAIYFDGNIASTRLDLTSHVRYIQNATPSVSFDTHRKHIAPTDSEISPLSERDVLPNRQRIYQLVLTYKFTTTKADTKATIRFSPCDGFIYDSWFEGKLMYVYNTNKKLIANQTIYPKSINLAKGDYIVKVQVRHYSPKHLEGITSTPLVVDIKLDKPVSLTVARSYNDLFAPSEDGSPKVGVFLEKGHICPLFVKNALQETSSIPKNAEAGDVLVGRVRLEFGYKTLQSFPAKWIVPVKKKPADGKGPAASNDDGTKKLQKKVNDLKLQMIPQIRDREQRQKLVAELGKDIPEDSLQYLQLLRSQMSVYDPDACRDLLAHQEAPARGGDGQRILEAPGTPTLTAENSSELGSLADKLITLATRDFGDGGPGGKISQLKLKPQTNEVKAEIKELEEINRHLTWALVHKCRALVTVLARLRAEGRGEDDGQFVEKLTALKDTFYRLKSKSMEPGSSEAAIAESVAVAIVEAALNTFEGRLGASINNLNSLLSKEALTEATRARYNQLWDKRVALLREIGWTAWVEYFEELVKYERPASFRIY